MQRQEKFYTIYTASNMNKELLQSWRIPSINDATDIKKQELIEIINIELKKGNFIGAIDILKESFKKLNMELPSELINLESEKVSNKGAHPKNALISVALSSMEKFLENDKFMGETKI